MKKLYVIFALCFTVSLAAQDRHPIDQLAYDQLQEAVATSEMINAQTLAYTGWDQLLNIVYLALRERMQPASFDALRASQRAWISYRDAEFNNINRIYYAELEGTMWRPVAVGARAAVVKKRVELLLAQYNVLALNFFEDEETAHGIWQLAGSNTRLELREDFTAVWQKGEDSEIEFFRLSDKCHNESKSAGKQILTFYKFGEPDSYQCFYRSLQGDNKLQLESIKDGTVRSFQRAQ